MGTSEDYASAQKIMRSAYIELMERYPTHELLRLAILHPYNKGLDLTSEYYKRCYRGDEHPIEGCRRYTFALWDSRRGKIYALLDTDPPCDF